MLFFAFVYCRLSIVYIQATFVYNGFQEAQEEIADHKYRYACITLPLPRPPPSVHVSSQHNGHNHHLSPYTVRTAIVWISEYLMCSVFNMVCCYYCSAKWPWLSAQYKWFFFASTSDFTHINKCVQWNNV